MNQGPGNFSGLRGSIATAKGVCLSNNLNLFGYDTFIWSCTKFLNKKDNIFILLIFREKYFIKKFDKKLNVILEAKEVDEKDIIENFHSEFKVIPKKISQQFSEKILKLNNLTIVDLNHKELEFLYLQGLLNKDLIKPLYLS